MFKLIQIQERMFFNAETLKYFLQTIIWVIFYTLIKSHYY